MIDSILQFLIGIGIVQSLLLGSVLLLNYGKDRLTSIILGTILLLTSFLLLSELLDLLDMGQGFKKLRKYSILLDLVLVVLIWWLTLAITGKKAKFLKADFIHLFPFALGLLWLETGFNWYGNESPGTFSHIPDAIGIFLAYKGVIWAIYVVGCIRIISSKKLQISDVPNKVRKRLLQKLIWPFIAISSISFFCFWLMFFGIDLPIDSDYLGAVLITAFTYFLTLSILWEPHLFIRTGRESIWPKYHRLKIDRKLDSDYLQRLRNYLEQEKPYLDQKLSLHALAQTLRISPNTISRIINEQLGQNFNDLINTYRLQEVKQKLINPEHDHKTILALAFESGFQSKASFNRVFKKMEGKTPSEYKESFRSHPTL
ncbi:helix-turn-helix domain-containing protein [Ulvibacterium sp.]|uniref:helix-turn-helix domain-containing protein n=1 Tax=Ulvibacterium sp. TaxID=2665914 RepID=UPI003CC5144E